MNVWELISIALIGLLCCLCPANGVSASEDGMEEDLAIPVCRYIGADETQQLNFSIDVSAAAASFLLDWGNVTSNVEMTLITPRGESIEPSAGGEYAYYKENNSLYYIVPNPQMGEWVAVISAGNVPGGSEEYCAFMVLDYEEVNTSGTPRNITSDYPADSTDESAVEICEDCNSS